MGFVLSRVCSCFRFSFVIIIQLPLLQQSVQKDTVQRGLYRGQQIYIMYYVHSIYSALKNSWTLLPH